MEAIDTSPQRPTSAQSPLIRDMMGVLRPWITGRRGLIIAAIALIGGGLTAGWSSLVAIGVAPLILSLAPCAAMCALGMCMMGKGAGGKSSCSQQSSTQNSEKTESSVASAVVEDRRSAGGA